MERILAGEGRREQHSRTESLRENEIESREELELSQIQGCAANEKQTDEKTKTVQLEQDAANALASADPYVAHRLKPTLAKPTLAKLVFLLAFFFQQQSTR